LDVYLFLQRAENATAEVVDYERKLSNPNSASSAAYYPIVSITSESGESIRAETNVGRSPPAFEIGAQINVLFDPDEPGKARVATPFGLWGAAALFAGFGFLFLIVGGIIRFRGRRSIRS